jgi:hypothetical protein
MEDSRRYCIRVDRKWSGARMQGEVYYGSPEPLSITRNEGAGPYITGIDRFLPLRIRDLEPGERREERRVRGGQAS